LSLSLQEERLADAVFVASFVVHTVPHIEELALGREIDKNAHAFRRVAAQGHDNDGAVSIKVGAFVKSFMGGMPGFNCPARDLSFRRSQKG